MTSMFDDESLEIECPNCNRPLRKTIRFLKTSPQLTCQRCGATFKVDASDLARELKKADKTMNNLLDGMGKAFK